MTAIPGVPGTATEFYRRYGRPVYAAAYCLLGDVRLAEEATEHTFVEAWPSVAGADAQRDIASWLTSIVVRTAKEIHQRERSASGSARLAAVWRVRSALDALSDEDRDLIRLQHHARMSDAEIADRLAIAPTSIAARSARAHRRLAEAVLGPIARTEAVARCVLGPASAFGRPEIGERPDD